MVTNNITIEEEKIIGKTLDKNKIKSNILYHIDFSKCKRFIDLIDKLYICKEYNNDKYYGSTFKEIFPSHDKIKDLIHILYAIEIDESIIKKININNIEEVLCEALKNSFKNKKLYQINNTLSKLKSYCGNNKEIEKLFPNYKILLQIINIIDEKRIDEIDRIISRASSYEEIYNILMDIKEINKSEKENQVNKYNKFINALNNTILKKHQILENKEEIKKIIASNNSLNNSLDELETKENNININIDKYTYNKKLTERETEKLSSNLIKYIANRIKIAKLNRTIEEYNKKISKTNLEKIAIEEEKNKIKELNEVLKTNFYNLSGIETIPNNYSVLEEYEKINDTRIIDRITELKLEVAKLKNELLIYETIDTKEEEETKKK